MSAPSSGSGSPFIADTFLSSSSSGDLCRANAPAVVQLGASNSQCHVDSSLAPISSGDLGSSSFHLQSPFDYQQNVYSGVRNAVVQRHGSYGATGRGSEEGAPRADRRYTACQAGAENESFVLTHDMHDNVVTCMQNEVYASLLQRASAAESKYAALKAEHDALRLAHQKLLETVPGKLSDTLRREDFPNVTYWIQEDWKQRDKSDELLLDASSARQRGKARAAKNINVMMTFVQTEEGQAVSGFYATNMRRKARKIWVQWKHDKKLMPKWSQIAPPQLAFFEMSMESEFPELKLCAHHWKCHEVARISYPNFIRGLRNQENKREGVIDEVETSSEDGDAGMSVEVAGHQKRRGAASKSTRPVKKLRANEEADVGVVAHPVTTRLIVAPQEAVADVAASQSLAIPEEVVLGDSTAENMPMQVDVCENVDESEAILTHKRQARPQYQADKENATGDIEAPGEIRPVRIVTPIVNPLASSSGNGKEYGIRARRESLVTQNVGREAAPGRDVVQEGPSKNSNERTAASEGTRGSEKVKYKRPNASLSAKNLYLIELVKDGTRITAEEFEEMWIGLGTDGQKDYADASKRAKTDKKTAKA
ncbi:hypothetical protein CERSUDRAFT_98311 [Gelatoporia subvermispora B]|uniref:Uncharacterized protein n=1 Tax=Ceriporiopsis subvermispora (strain B) TaxID=914234 RepID=M2R4B7_CERS8|nr:hypothetical protein CERSUDRAFT_98311 [Gelatoporia subvermispora B]